MKKAAAVFLTAVLLGGCCEPALPTEPAVTESVTAPATEPVTVPVTEPVLPETVPPTEEPTSPPAEDAFVPVAEYVPHVRVELAYATEQNFTNTRIYDFTDAYLRYATVQKLAQAGALLAEQGYGLLIWDAYRPVEAQARLWEAFPDPVYVSRPGTGSQTHCRGIAVDLTLYDLQTGEMLEMPTGFDDFSARADRDYGDCTEDAARNAQILEYAMSACGFKPYQGEWWHFTDTQSFDVEYDFYPE